MEKISIKLTPLLRALGFTFSGESLYHIYDEGKMMYECRVYKRGGGERYIEMVRSFYDEYGLIHHRETVLKDFPVDSSHTNKSLIFYTEVLTHLAITIRYANRTFIRLNMDYLLGLTEERVEV